MKNKTCYFNANLYTQDRQCCELGYFIVQDDKFSTVAFGQPPADVLNECFGKYDLNGRSVLPGFFDSHIHLWKVGQLATHILDLRGVKSIRELQEKLAAFADQQKNLSWIVARGYNETLFSEGRALNRRDIDAAISERPVFVQRTCAHIGVANSLALLQSRIDTKTQCPAGGHIEKDENFEPTGLLAETAQGLVTKNIPARSAVDLREAITVAMKKMHALGITGVCDPGVKPELMDVYRVLNRDQLLPLRCQVMALHLSDDGETIYPLPNVFKSDYLNIDTVKYFADGALSGATAAVHKAYRCSHNHGLLRLGRQQFLELAGLAGDQGLSVAVHAIGDAAIDLAIETFDSLSAKKNANGFRIEHCGLPTAAHWEYIRLAGIGIATQPIFLYELGQNFRKVLEPEELERCYPFSTMVEKNIRAGFSSDGPVVQDINPWRGIEAAVTRIDSSGQMIGEHEKISLAAAIELYTAGSARVCGFENRCGKIESGHWADFTIWAHDPFKIPTNTLHTLNLSQTFVGGRCVYHKEQHNE